MLQDQPGEQRAASPAAPEDTSKQAQSQADPLAGSQVSQPDSVAAAVAAAIQHASAVAAPAIKGDL